jgi:sialate O-acetylesterase
MKLRLRFRFLNSVLLLLLVSGTAMGEVRLPNVLGSRMVLQRDAPVRIWGWAEAGEQISVSLGDAVRQVTADSTGSWQVQLPAQAADGQKRTIQVVGSNTVELTDLLVGDVWIGSGQSNMAWQLKSTDGADSAIAAADHPEIRLFHIPRVKAPAPADDVDAEWSICKSASIPEFSAVLYYFGLKLHQETNVPIGLINTSWGGSAIEPWTVTESGSGEMYNGMVAPIVRLSVRGAIWYQGETNVLHKNGFSYANKMRDLITGWRRAFHHDSLPFYYVQIAPWSGRYEAGQLPALWEAQTATLNLPNTGMAVTTDLVDDISDIHPRNKLDVGNRLALWALARHYGDSELVFSGPIFKSMTIDGNTARIDFHFSGGGLKSRDDAPLSEFRIAGADGEFFDAKATITEDAVLVSSDNVAEPTQVRFGWHKLANPNLTNSAGLPASPFQTKDWRGTIESVQ